MRRLFICLVLSMICVSGCVTLGTRTLPESITSIYIPYVKNQTMEPGIEEQVTDALNKEFIKDGRLRVVAAADADTALEGYISEYKISPVERNAAGRTVSYSVSLSVVLSLRDMRTGETLMPPTTFSEGGVYFLSSLPGKKRQSEILARLGEDVISRVIEGW